MRGQEMSSGNPCRLTPNFGLFFTYPFTHPSSSPLLCPSQSNCRNRNRSWVNSSSAMTFSPGGGGGRGGQGPEGVRQARTEHTHAHSPCTLHTHAQSTGAQGGAATTSKSCEGHGHPRHRGDRASESEADEDLSSPES